MLINPKTYHHISLTVTANTIKDDYELHILEGCHIVLYRSYRDVHDLIMGPTLVTNGISTLPMSPRVSAIRDATERFRHLKIKSGGDILLKIYETPQYHARHGSYVAWQPVVPIVTWDTVIAATFVSHSIPHHTK